MTMSVDEAIRARRSVRGFLPTALPEPVLREVFALAQWAPSNCNTQPWVPHVVSGAALSRLTAELVALAAAGTPQRADWSAETRFEGVYRTRQVDAAVQLYGALGVARDDRAGRHAAYVRNQAAFGAPHVVFVFMPQPFDARESTDLGLWAQTLMLAFTARGIASCAQGALGLYPDVVRRHLGLPASQRLMFGIAFGLEDPAEPANAARVGRAPPEEAVVFHTR